MATAWVAFTESTPRNGNMQVIPGSHRSQAPHVDTFHPEQPPLARQAKILYRGTAWTTF